MNRVIDQETQTIIPNLFLFHVLSPLLYIRFLSISMGLLHVYTQICVYKSRYGIPLDTLRDWEQGRCEPDHTGYAYLRVIAVMPEAVQQALQPAPVQ